MSTEHVMGIKEQAVLAKDTPLGGPGAVLRKARIAAQLSELDVANRLYLTSHMVTTIENDDYHNAPDPVFVRGYLRAYAKFLRLNQDEIIHMFNKLDIPRPNHAVKFKVKRRDSVLKRQLSLKEHPIRWLTIVIVTGVIALSVMWFNNYRQGITLKDGEAISVPVLGIENVNDDPLLASAENKAEFKVIREDNLEQS